MSIFTLPTSIKRLYQRSPAELPGPELLTSDIVTRFSGGTTNTDARASIGGAMSRATEGVWLVDEGPRLFDDRIGIADGAVDYRCIYLHNTHPSEPFLSVFVWARRTAGRPYITLATGAPAGAAQFGTPVAPMPPDAFTPPNSVTFVNAKSEATALRVGDIGPGEAFPLFLRRIAHNNPFPSFSSHHGFDLVIYGRAYLRARE